MVPFVSLTVGVLLLLWIGFPIFRGRSLELGLRVSRPSRRSELREEKARMMMALRELDFDYETGKLSVADYKALRAKYEGTTVTLLKELETLEADWVEKRSEIDRLVAKRIGKPRATPSAPSVATSAQTPPQASSAGGFCSKCGAPQGANARFCGKCGAPRVKAAHG